MNERIDVTPLPTIWDVVNEEYKEIEACNIPGGGEVPLPPNSIRPVRPPSVPVF